MKTGTNKFDRYIDIYRYKDIYIYIYIYIDIYNYYNNSCDGINAMLEYMIELHIY